MIYNVYENYIDQTTFDRHIDVFETLEEAKEFKAELARGASEGLDKEAFCEAEEDFQIVPSPSDMGEADKISSDWDEYDEEWKVA